MAVEVTLQCEECGERNYRTGKTKVMVQSRIKHRLKKYCPRDKRHTWHKEVK